MKPILFNTQMVQAILEGRKTTTRRIIKRTPSNDEPCGYGFWKEFNERDNRWYIKDYTHAPIWWTLEEYISNFSNYNVGDIFYVRETWCRLQKLDDNEMFIDGTERYYYKADDWPDYNMYLKDDGSFSENIPWRSSIHMPKDAARIFLKVTSVNVERLQDITYEDVINEGLKVGYDGWITEWKSLWNSTLNKNQVDMYGWDANPYVWVVGFERVDKEETK